MLDHDGFILSLNDLYQEGVRYLVLRETKVPEGYRSPGDIHFYLAGNKDGNKVIKNITIRFFCLTITGKPGVRTAQSDGHIGRKGHRDR